MALIILDLQHRGKPHRPHDQGAVHDMDGDGRVEVDETEVHQTLDYVAAMTRTLAMMGHHVAIIAEGRYSQRHEEAAALARAWLRRNSGQRVIYCACHVNSAGVNYGLILHDHRSQAGQEAAQAVARHLERQLNGREAKVASASAERWANAYATIRGVYTGPAELCGLCLEPTAMDQAEDLSAEGATALGLALAQGLDAAARRLAG